MTFPTAYTVEHYAWTLTGVEDELGNDEGDWAEQPVTRAVIGWSTGISERYATGTSEVYDATLSCPPDWTPGPRDRIVLDGDLYEVVQIRKQDSGFHGWQPGSVALLKAKFGG